MNQPGFRNCADPGLAVLIYIAMIQSGTMCAGMTTPTMDVDLYPEETAEEDYKVIRSYLKYLRAVYPEVRDHILSFLEDLLRHTTITTANMDSILNGAYTVVHGDGCHLYAKYAKYQYKKQGWVAMSSHGKHMQQPYRMGAGSLAACSGGQTHVHCKDADTDTDLVNPHFDVLIGCHIATGDTAFQFEKVRIDTAWNAAGHVSNYMKYARKGRKNNIGVFGTSEHVDKKPLVLKKCVKKAATGGRPCHHYNDRL
jgi:hypothetical protein